MARGKKKKKRRKPVKTPPPPEVKSAAPSAAPPAREQPSDPRVAEAMRCCQQRQFARGEALLQQALAENPDAVDALTLMASIALQAGAVEDALRFCQRALAIRSDYVDALFNLGSVHRATGNYSGAQHCYERVVALRPDNAAAQNNLGQCYQELGHAADAVAAFELAARLNPAAPEPLMNLGNQAWLDGELEEAERYFRKGIAVGPDYWKMTMNLGALLLSQGRVEETRLLYEDLRRRFPDIPDIYNNLAFVLADEGRIEEAIAHCRTALKLRPEYAAAHSNLVLDMHYAPFFRPADVFAEHRRFGQLHESRMAERRRPHRNAPDPARRLRVGYVSNDFRRHSVAFFLEPVLGAHDHARVEVVCYYGGGKFDEVTGRFRTVADTWRETGHLSDIALADQVRDDGIDILVDLGGHTSRGRLLTFAQKPAPVQVTWLGYPDTTGLSRIDYRLTDRWADPPGTTEAWHTEELVHLPNGFLCYGPPPEAPAVKPLPAKTNGYITYGSFNNYSKLSEESVRIWAELLKANPEAKLLLKNKALRDEAMRARLLERFAACDIGAERLETIGFVESFEAHLDLYGRVDISLDTFPYHGTTTTCESLWMGVPTVTLAGVTHVSRVGASLLRQSGMESLITTTPEEFIAKAMALGSELDTLAELRLLMREQLANSSLTDAPGFARILEEAFRQMWQRWCERTRGE